MSPGFGLALCRDDRGCEAERGRGREKEGERESDSTLQPETVEVYIQKGRSAP